MKYHKFNKLVLFVGIMLMMSVASCSKFLDTKPTDFLSPVNYYETEAQLKLALNGVYDQLGSIGLYGQRIPYIIGFEGDEAYYTRNTPGGVYSNDFTAGHPEIRRYWLEAYAGINRANVLLQNIDKNESIDLEYRDLVRAEAKFLRAYYYFLLVQSFGDVPLMLEPTTNINTISIPRTSAKLVYEKIIDDMTAAEQKVESITSIGFGGRVSKSAVRGILARVCLHMAGYPVLDESKYLEARNWAKKVIDDTQAGHELNPDFSDIFIRYARDQYDIKESIWEVEFWGITGTYNEAGYNGYVNGPVSTNNNTGQGFAGLRTTAELYHLFDVEDLRRDWSIANFTYDAAGPSGSKTPITATPTDANLYNRNPAKFRREYETLTPKQTNNTPQNWPLLRYADVLLMFAEADNKLTVMPSDSAITAVNLVRRRGYGKLLPGATNIDEFDVSGHTKGTFHQLIIDERSRELCIEELRKHDLIRWGIYVTNMNRVGNNILTHVPNAFYGPWYLAVEDKHNLWPIPLTEFSLNPALVQNEGW